VCAGTLKVKCAHPSGEGRAVSEPNTKNLRALQGGSELDALLGALKAE